MPGPGRGLNRPHTPEEIAHLRQVALERIESEKNEKGKKGADNPGGGSSGRGGAVPGGSDPRGGSPSGAPGAGAVPGAGGVPGGADPGGSASKAGRKIQKRTNTTEVVRNTKDFINGPVARLHFKAGNNLLKLFNLLPLPIKLELDELTEEESQIVADAMRPGLEMILPSAGKKHPYLTLAWTGIVAFFGKLKARWVGFSNKKRSPENDGRKQIT